MKKYLFLLTVIVVLVSCNKTHSDDSTLLEGKWQMVAARDNASGAVTSKPGNLGDVIITFSAGKLSGKTPSNDIYPSDYTVGPGNKLSVPAIGATKVGEDAWGILFYKNMYYIESFSFKTSNRLFIGTREKTLEFERQ